MYAAGYAMIAPFFVLFLLFNVLPILWGFILSFTHYNIIQPMRFAGLTNYIELLTNDDLFMVAFRNTFTFAMISGPIGFMSSFFFAWIINQLRFRNAFSLAFYAPSIASGTAIGVVWLVMFSPDRLGIINNVLLRLGVINDPIRWTIDPVYILPLIILISIWMSLGAGFLTNLAGLNNIPYHLYEAGRIDGIRNRFQELVFITLPQMKPYLLFSAIMSTVSALNVGAMAAQVAGFPSPDYAAHTIVLHMQDHGFLRFELGYASAIAFILFLFNFSLGRIFRKMLSSND